MEKDELKTAYKEILHADAMESEWGSKASKMRKVLCDRVRLFKDGQVVIDAGSYHQSRLKVISASIRRGDLHVTYNCSLLMPDGKLGKNAFLPETGLRAISVTEPIIEE